MTRRFLCVHLLSLLCFTVDESTYRHTYANSDCIGRRPSSQSRHPDLPNRPHSAHRHRPHISTPSNRHLHDGRPQQALLLRCPGQRPRPWPSASAPASTSTSCTRSSGTRRASPSCAIMSTLSPGLYRLCLAQTATSRGSRRS